MCKEILRNEHNKLQQESSYLLKRPMMISCQTSEKQKTIFVGSYSNEDKMGTTTRINEKLIIILEDCSKILDQLEDWVERLMDEGQWLQARVLVDKTFEARHLVQRATDAENEDDAVYLHGILQRVKAQYDPMGSFVKQVTQCRTMLRYLDTRVVACMKRSDEIENLRNKIIEARFLVDRAVTKRDQRQIDYLLDVIRRLFVSYQSEFTPYKQCSERRPTTAEAEVDEKQGFQQKTTNKRGSCA